MPKPATPDEREMPSTRRSDDHFGRGMIPLPLTRQDPRPLRLLLDKPRLSGERRSSASAKSRKEERVTERPRPARSRQRNFLCAVRLRRSRLMRSRPSSAPPTAPSSRGLFHGRPEEVQNPSVESVHSRPSGSPPAALPGGVGTETRCRREIRWPAPSVDGNLAHPCSGPLRGNGG